MTAAAMVHASPRSARLLQRFMLMAMLGLALASRLALGATVPADSAADGARMTTITRLQAAMVMCDPGASPAAPKPDRHQKACCDDLLIWDLAESAHTLPAAPTPLPRMALQWVAVDFAHVSLIEAPARYRSSPQPRGPPSSV